GEAPGEVGRRQDVGVLGLLVDRARLVVHRAVVERTELYDAQDLRVPGLGGGAGLDHAQADVAVPALAGQVELDVAGQRLLADPVALQRIPHGRGSRVVVWGAVGTQVAVIRAQRR